MSSKQKLILSSLFLVLLVFGASQPSQVWAALSITSVTPAVVVNDIANTITITGTDFAADAQVKIGGSDLSTSAALITNRISETQLLANLPKDYPPGVYTIYVVNPGESISVPAGLTVVAPTPIPTITPGGYARPQLSIASYSINVDGIRFGKNFTLSVSLKNSGGESAHGIQVSFLSSELLMLKNGGVIAAGDLAAGSKVDLTQVMTAASPYYGVSRTALEMNVSYFDKNGAPFTDKFTLILSVFNTVTGLAAPTATPTGVHFPQLIISDYRTNLDQLEPGAQFTLELTIKNQGDLAANSVLMIVGGGSPSQGGSGTPGPGGVSGGGGDFTNFAPVGSSNLQSLGDIPVQSSLVATHQMIVNVNTNPGAYPMRVTFSYTDPNGNAIIDEQIITLLVFRLPLIDISFYQPVGDLFAYQPNLLPLQVVNIGRNYAILGNLMVTSGDGLVENGQTFLGGLESGGYFTLDVMFTPGSVGQEEILVTIDYTDDFNQTRTITKVLPLNSIEMEPDPALDPAAPEGQPGLDPQPPETWWGKIWRFIRGLLGLDSSPPEPAPAIEGDPEIVPKPNYKPGKG